MKQLTPDEISDNLKSIPNWNRKNVLIQRTFKFDEYFDGIEFATKVGRIAERLNHHPDITVRWRAVDVVTTTHDAGGITEMDFRLARWVDAISEGYSLVEPEPASED
jgi:4a-hydroxytetrahydrobiopterin dehydratase